jgi:dihydropteroate synthase
MAAKKQAKKAAKKPVKAQKNAKPTKGRSAKRAETSTPPPAMEFVAAAAPHVFIKPTEAKAVKVKTSETELVKKTASLKQAEPDVPRIDATYESKNEWRADPRGYFLIKLFPEKKEIGVRWCGYDKKPRMDVYGKDAEAIVQTLVRESTISSLQHAAYLGHELMKAEIALKLNMKYVQDAPLEFSKK